MPEPGAIPADGVVLVGTSAVLTTFKLHAALRLLTTEADLLWDPLHVPFFGNAARQRQDYIPLLIIINVYRN